ncbi:DUF2304 family protein [Candidatus Woesearchaeota archaeon]|nr:DUF2304 family protein [Candidatus Woesearchaeota archaeon]
MVSLLQVIVIVFVLFAITRVFFRYQDKMINTFELVFWSLIWIAVAVVLFVPTITEPIARLFNVGRGIDIAVYFSIVLLFYLVFRLYVKLDTMNNELTKVVRKEAVKKRK